jgi:hypothetical protein
MTDSIPYDVTVLMPVSRDFVAVLRDIATTAKRDDHDPTVRENDANLLAFADACDAALDKLPCAACGVAWVEHAALDHPFAALELSVAVTARSPEREDGT